MEASMATWATLAGLTYLAVGIVAEVLEEGREGQVFLVAERVDGVGGQKTVLGPGR